MFSFKRSIGLITTMSSENIKAVDPRTKLSFDQASTLLRDLYGITGSQMSTLPCYVDQNFLVVSQEGSRFVLKIMNAKKSENAAHIEFQNLTIAFLHKQGFPVQKVMPTSAGKLMSMEEFDFGQGALTYCVRLFTFIPGKSIYDSKVTLEDLYQVGKIIAEVSKTLQQLDPPIPEVLLPKDNPWSFVNITAVLDFLSVMDGDPLQEVILDIVQACQANVFPKIGSFRKGIIHNDLSDQNILVTPALNGHHDISGVLDFDMLEESCIVFDLAVSITYHMLNFPNPLDVGRALLAGWQSIMVLNEEEKDSLYLLVLARLCQSLVYGRDNVRKNPENMEYLTRTAQNGERVLKMHWDLGKEEVMKKWFSDVSKFKKYFPVCTFKESQ